jgi:preprotein translocase subunit SecY
VTFNPVDVADNMKKFGGFIPGIRPGKKTAEYIDAVLTRITSAAPSTWRRLPAADAAPDVSSTCRSTSAAPRSDRGLRGARHGPADRVHLITRHYEGLTGPGGPRIRGRKG